MSSRSQRIVSNILSTLGLQAVSLICGLIVPRLLLSEFGSEINGTVSSITTFLGYIALLEAGVGGVVRAALYKPLANHDASKLSGILRATQSFFNKIAIIFVVYMAVLACAYPFFVSSSFEWGFTASLVLIIGISTIAQYLFGITYQLLLESDQKSYIFNTFQMLSIVANAVIVLILVKLHFSIHMVKLFSSAIFVIRPALMSLYVRKHYKIVRKCPPDQEAISQRWNGFGQHIAYFVHKNTDVAVLSVMRNLLEVSVYTVHFVVVNGISTVVSSLSSGFSAAIGDMIAKDEKDTLNRTVNLFEFATFFLTSVLFTITALMIEPFVMLYTKGVEDINYFQPVFAYILCAAEGVAAIRNVYATIVLNAGHYKQTSLGAYVEAVINIVLSIILVHYFGLVGVAIGTLAAMSYRMINYVWYLKNHILNRSIRFFVKRMIVSAIGISISWVLCRLLFRVDILNWWHWIIVSALTSLVVLAVQILINLIFYRNDSRMFLKKLKNKISK